MTQRKFSYNQISPPLKIQDGRPHGSSTESTENEAKSASGAKIEASHANIVLLNQ